MDIMHAEVVKKYCEQNTEPKKELYPHFQQEWSSSSGRVVFDSVSGERRTYADREVQRYTPSQEYNAPYIEYVKKYDMLEIASIYCDGHRGKDGVPTVWHYDCDRDYWCGYRGRFFIFKGDTSVYNRQGREVMTSHVCTYYNKGVLNFINSTLYRHLRNNMIVNEIRLFTGNEKCSGLYDLYTYVQKKLVERKPTKQTTTSVMYDKYMEETEEFTEFESSNDVGNVVYFEVHEEFAVIRMLTYNNIRYNYNCNTCRYEIIKNSDEVNERYRIFIDTKGVPKVFEKQRGEWNKVSGKFNLYYYSSTKSIFAGDSLADFKPTKWLLPCVELDNAKVVEKIINMLRHPIIESLIKSGYPEIARILLGGNEIKANLTNYFSGKEKKNASIYQMTGLNKYALAMIENYIKEDERSYSHRVYSVAKTFKTLMGKDDLTYLSKESVEELLPFAKYVCVNLYGRVGDVLPNVEYHYGYRWRNEQFTVTEEDLKGLLRIYRMCRKADPENVHDFDTFKDTVQMWKYILDINKPNINIMKIDSIDELNHIHDMLNEIRHEQEEFERAKRDEAERLRLEEKQKKFEKTNGERIKKYDADSVDGRFIIRVPRRLIEIREEGNQLGHCVAGYVNSHAVGETNIIFLRKAIAPETSFYTIEVKNGRLVQLHGKYNKWLGNDPEAIPFVYQWLKDKGIQFDKNILLNKSVGYSRGSDYLPDSYLKGVM